jgi:hypothetical protein
LGQKIEIEIEIGIEIGIEKGLHEEPISIAISMPPNLAKSVGNPTRCSGPPLTR